jgi:L-threonylcarbamoyladenylate synthase
MPENEIALKLIQMVGNPLATPSANISDKPSGTNYQDIIKDFHGKIDYFIDSGSSKIGKASTIVKVENDEIFILREGAISKKDILLAIS